MTFPEICSDPTAWNSWAASQRHGGHLLQSWEWGEFKSRHGWAASRLIWRSGGDLPTAVAQILERRVRTPVGEWRIQYCPRGPLLTTDDAGLRQLVLQDLANYARRRRAIFIKIDPEWHLTSAGVRTDESTPAPTASALGSWLADNGWRYAREQIQFRNTMLLSLSPPEEQLLAGMKQKTRYNIRLASRRQVQVRMGDSGDLGLLYQLYAITSRRDGFVIRPETYYRDVWGSFMTAGLAQGFIAEVEGRAIAGLIVFRFGRRAWFLYGMSSELHRDRMPNYLLQWEAIRWAKTSGCTGYDFWGAPDQRDLGDPLWGVYRFKEGFGAQMVETIGAWDFVLRPAIYYAYGTLLPILLNMMRRRGRARIRAALE
jgi:peptidoglycan pentaglycine glycine transferase (the first glycine)